MQGAPRTHTDASARPLAATDLRIALSSRAELRCSCCACASAEVPDGVLSSRELLTIVAAFARLGVRRVRLAGANPASRPDLLALVAAIRETPGIDDVAVTTSGSHLQAIAARYRAAGVTRLAVAVDTLDAARLRRVGGRGASLPALVAGVAAAARAGFASLKLNIVVVRGLNDAELGTIVRFAWRHAAVPRLIELMPYGRGEPVPLVEVKELLRRGGIRLAPDAVRGWGPAECLVGEDERDESPGSGPVRLVGPMAPERCTGCNRVRVGPDGTLRRCLALPRETPLGPLVRRGAGPDELVPHLLDALRRRSPPHPTPSGGARGPVSPDREIDPRGA